MTWDEYCERYLTERKINLESFWKEISPCVYHPSNEDIQWLIQALEDEQRKWFVAFIVKKATGGLPKRLKRVLFSPLIRAAVYERNPSLNRYFVEPCVDVFGREEVYEALLDLVEQGSNFEKAGAVNALYWVGSAGSTRKSAPIFLTEFVNNSNLDVRRSIIPRLTLDPSHYADELKPLVLEAIEIAKNHSDDYIRHRVEVQLGTEHLLKPLPHREPNTES